MDVLLKLGAVPFCKTNIPQTLMVSMVENNLGFFLFLTGALSDCRLA